MKCVVFAGAALALAVLAATPAAAQPRSTEFTVDGTVFTVPIPEGFCDQGVAVEAYKRQKRRDHGEVAEVTLMPCGSTAEGEPELFSISVNRQRGANMQREPFLTAMARSLPLVPGEPDLSAEPGATHSDRLASRLVRRVGAGEGVSAIGVDDFCAYVGGRQGPESGRAFDMYGAGCTTVIGGHILLISRYGRGVDPAKVRAAIPEVKALALSIGAQRQ